MVSKVVALQSATNSFTLVSEIIAFRALVAQWRFFLKIMVRHRCVIHDVIAILSWSSSASINDIRQHDTPVTPIWGKSPNDCPLVQILKLSRPCCSWFHSFLFPTVDPRFHCSLCDDGLPSWGLKCLTFNRHMPRRPATYEERRGYVYDADACGQGVQIYILGMWTGFLSVLVATQILTAGTC